MSAVPGHFMDEKPQSHAEERDEPSQHFWHWFALAVLLFAWIAEATMCAERGF